MTFLIADSFDFINTAYDSNDLIDRGWNLTQTPQIDTGTVHDGRGSLFMTTNESLQFYMDTATTDSYFISVWFYRSSISGSDLIVFGTASGGGSKWTIRMDAGGKIYWEDPASSQVGSLSSNALPAGQWFHIEAKFTCLDSCSTGDCVVKINGDIWLDLDGEDTNYLSAANLIRYVGMEGQANTYIDSAVIWNSASTGTWSDWIGMIRMETIRPTGNGTTNDFTGSDADSTDNYLHVDELQYDEDGTYVESDTITDVDLYGYGNLTSSIQSIVGVQAVCVAEKDVTGSRQFKQLARTGTTNYQGAAISPSVDDYITFVDTWLVDPDTAVAWIESGVNAAEFGVEVTA